MPIPANDPDLGQVEFMLERLGELRAPVEERLERMDASQRRTALWLIALEGVALFRSELADVSGLEMLAFGVHALGERPRWWRRRSRFAGDDRSLAVTAFFDSESGLDRRLAELEPIVMEDAFGQLHRIPLRREPWRLTLHSPSLNLRDATICCWVEPLEGGEAILTAAHAAIGNQVEMEDGSLERVLWHAPGSLDALVAESPGARGLRPLPLEMPDAEDRVEVLTKTGVQGRTIADRGLRWGTTTSAIPHRFLLDRPLEPGDSGSLVRLTTGGEGLGLYIGEVQTSMGPRGLCQGLYQLDSLFKFESKSKGFFEE